jgi:hypothetical protein
MKGKRSTTESRQDATSSSPLPRIESVAKPILYTEDDAIEYARERGRQAARMAHRASATRRKEKATGAG